MTTAEKVIEQRLGKTLLQLARTLGEKDQQSTRIELKGGSKRQRVC
jgi:hypothetical protein